MSLNHLTTGLVTLTDLQKQKVEKNYGLCMSFSGEKIYKPPYRYLFTDIYDLANTAIFGIMKAVTIPEPLPCAFTTLTYNWMRSYVKQEVSRRVFIRARKGEVPPQVDVLDPDSLAFNFIPSPLSKNSDLELVEELLKPLNSVERFIVEKRLFYEESFRDIADMCGMSRPTVIQKYRTALTKLKGKFYNINKE